MLLTPPPNPPASAEPRSALVQRHDHRHERTVGPSAGRAARDAAVRVALPAAVLWVVVVGLGLLIEGPLGGLSGELALNTWFVDHRTPTGDAVSAFFTTVGSTPVVIGACLVAIALIAWRTRWWLGAIPGIAVATQALVFVTSAAVVDRDRPEVPQLDDAPPTASFPSGHVGATTALYVSLALLAAARVRHRVLRWVLVVLSLAVPVLVALSRLYRGMHHLTDVLAGALVGLTCALLAWHWLRRDDADRR